MTQAPKANGHALTPIQAGMLYEVLAQDTPLVNLEQVVLHLDDEPVDAVRMAQIWHDAIARHPALRLAFRPDPSGQMRQVVGPVFEPPLQVEDWTQTPDQDAALAAWLDQDRARGVDLSDCAGWRLTWLRHGATRSTLIWTFSHVALDGRSFRAILQEVFAAYDGTGPKMAESPPPFVAHCDALAQADLAPARAFFATYLAGFDKPTKIGFAASPKILRAERRNQTLAAALTAAQTRAITDRAAVTGVSFATLVQAAWAVVLARISGHADTVFGVTRSGRYLTPQARDMVGCLITTQPLRVTVGPQVTLDDMLAAVRDDLVAQRPHEGASLPDIAAVTDIPPGAALFDSLVMIERESLHAALSAAGGAWRTRRVEVLEQGAVPLTLAVYGDDALQVQLEYMPGRISAADAERYLDYVIRMMVAMSAAAPGTLVRDIAMMPADETACLLDLAKPVAADVVGQVRASCIAAAFEAMAAVQPASHALGQIGALGRFDYASLDQRANQLAHTLVQAGIGPGAIVGLCLPRGPDFVAMVLAIAKTGAAFLPMDPSYPADALAHMATDSGAALIVTDLGAAWMGTVPVLVMSDALGQAASGAPLARGGAGFGPDRAAYVIYTSGTTGAPKGVVVSQASLVAHAQAAISGYGLGPNDRVLQFAALSFDVALEEIVPTLLAGAALVLRDDAMMVSPQAFAEAIATQGVTVLNLPTGFWQVLLAALEAGTARLAATVRLVIVGGERMPPDALRRWQALPGVPRLLNGYGPTEAVITSAVFDPVGGVDGAEVPVGRAFGHARLYLCAPDGSLAPQGARAELFIGGDAVALGYLNQPVATAQRFVPDRFAGGGRMYRSGDMAFWASQGQVVIAGRSDRQIKLRGFRIEPAEVEAVLERMPGLAQAHVGVADGRLIGWLRASIPDAPPDLAAVAAYVATQLPAAQCPELIFVHTWPQTPGGKTNVRRLPAPAHSPQALTAPEIGDPQVARIADIFGEVLGRDEVQPTVSFFDLGGHSLQLLTLIGHIEAVFSTRLTVAQVHAQPTPQGLAGLLSGPVNLATGTDLYDCLMPIQPLGGGMPIYGVHVLGVNGSFFRPLAKAMGLDQPIFGLTVGLLSADTPTSVAGTAALYFQAIQAHRPTGPLALVAVSLGSFMALELAQQLRAAGRDVHVLVMMDAAGPGGRDNIRGMAWLRAHLALLRAGGLGYASGLISAKIDAMRHRLEKFRLYLGGAFSQDPSAPKSVDGFVAANAVAVQAYRPEEYHGRMMVVRAKDSVFDSERAIATGLGWSEVAQGGFEVVDVPGDHLSILEEPGVSEVAAVLAQDIARANRST